MKISATLAAAGALLSGAVLYWVRQGDATGRVVPHIAVVGAAFVAYLAALAVADRVGPKTLLAALTVAVVWRAALVTTPPILSDDVFRYVWEGRIQTLGGNPYLWDDRPDAPRWEEQRDLVWQGMNHKGYTAFYPPFWQIVARAVVAVHDSVVAMKIFLVLCELGAVVVLLQVLRGRALPAGRVLVLAWSPLALVEIAGSGHNDGFGLLLVSLGLWAVDRGRSREGAVALALGAATKVLPGFIGLSWFRRFRPRDVAVAAAVLALVTWPYASAGTGILQSLQKYGAYWRFNETLFALIAPFFADQSAATRAAAILLFAFSAFLGWRRTEPATAGLAVAAAALLLSANVLPWYALWLLPFLVVRDCPPALLYTGTASLAYLVYPIWQSGERWHIGWDVRALEYLPCVLVGIVWLWRLRRKERAAVMVFVKVPQPRLVKTRLAEAIGDEGAAQLYRAVADGVRHRTRAATGLYDRIFFYTPAEGGPEVAAWLPGETCVPQQGPDLGARMAAAFDWAFAQGAKRAVLVGTDTPELGATHLEGALEALKDHDVALGPSTDGGYYLIGLRQPRPALFEAMAWSTPSVLEETRRRAAAAGLSIATLPALPDLDTPDDLRRAWPALRGGLPRKLRDRLAALLEARRVSG